MKTICKTKGTQTYFIITELDDLQLKANQERGLLERVEKIKSFRN